MTRTDSCFYNVGNERRDLSKGDTAEGNREENSKIQNHEIHQECHPPENIQRFHKSDGDQVAAVVESDCVHDKGYCLGEGKRARVHVQ